MSVLNFPNSGLTVGDQYTGDNGTSYTWDGVKWVGRAAGGAAGTNSLQNGTNTVQVDSSGNLVTPAFTIPNTAGTNGQVLKWPSSGTTLVWSADNNSGGGGGDARSLVNGSYTVGIGDDGKFLTDNTTITSIDLRDATGRGFYTNSDGITLRADSSNNVIFRPDGSVEIPNIIKSKAGNYYAATSDTSTEMSWTGAGGENVPVYAGVGSGDTGTWIQTSTTDNTGNWINKNWNFELDGSITFPVNLTNNRTGAAEALVFKKSGNQKSIATQGGTAGSPTVERLVIAGGDSYFDGTNWSGEGGDLYLWAGRGADGGDIKIDAGNSLNAGNEGGTIKIRGGSANTGEGGSILIQAGGSNTGMYGGITIENASAISHSTYDNVRVRTYSWQFSNEGVLHSGGGQPILVDNYIRSKYGSYLGLGSSYNSRNSNTVRFSNADGTPQTTYTVDAGTYWIGGIENAVVNQIDVYYQGQHWNPDSVTYDNGSNTFTFTFGSSVTLLASTDYFVEWFYPDTSAGVEINAGDKYWWFDGSDGKIYMPQGGELGEESWTTPIASVSFGTETIINLTASEFSGPTTGQVIIQYVPGGHPLNGTWYFQAWGNSQIKLFSFEDYSAPVDSSQWPAWSSGGSVRLPKEVILKTNGYKWRFGNDGSTNFPNGKQVRFSEEIDAYIQAGTQTPYLTSGLNLVGGEDGVAVVTIDNSDPGVTPAGHTWQFKKTGDLELAQFVQGASGGAQFDAVQTQNVTAGEPPSVVFTSINPNVESIKALVTVISTGAPTGNGPTVTMDTQICEMLITTRYQSYDGAPNVKTAVATVYGVTHTSDVPLATFTVNLIQNFGVGTPYARDVIQILAEPTAAVITQMSVKVVATEIMNYF